MAPKKGTGRKPRDTSRAKSAAAPTTKTRAKQPAPRRGRRKPTRKAATVSRSATSTQGGVSKRASAVPPTVAGGKRERLLKKGGGVVDVHSGKVDTCHVYEDNTTTYQFTLNQANISVNNNKFYITQLLEDDQCQNYFIFARWGRVGSVGQKKLEPCRDLSHAKKEFCSKFYQKTRNQWASRESFTKAAGKYEYMDIDYGGVDGGAGSNEPNGGKEAEVSARESQLPEEVQNLMRLIGCRDSMSRVLQELEVDTERMPLGKISTAQLLRAYEVLRDVEKMLKGPLGRLEELSGRFYTLIPHNLGSSRLPVIRTTEMLQQKKEMLETLTGLEVASTLLDAGNDEGLHPLDNMYKKMKCTIKSLKTTSDVYKRIVEYVRNTQGPTHNAYNLKVVEVFTLQREEERERPKPFKNMVNRQMLWHGSRTTNFMGILSQGLRIAPPEAPCTGYMFGKGIYFSDVCSKSANYCHPSPGTNTGLLLLCEVALGKQKEYSSAHYMLEPEKGTNSTKGVGRMYPDPKGAEVIKGVLWPKGRIAHGSYTTSLIYPEHIVYDTSQCALKYLVRVIFEYGD